MFWTSKAIQHTLEQLVKGAQQFFEQWKAESEERKQQEEEIRRKEEEEKGKVKIRIQYFPGSELFVLLDDVRINSEDISRERFDELVELYKAHDVDGIKNLLLPKKEEGQSQLEIAFQREESIKDTVLKVKTLVDTGDFEVVENSVFLKGVDRSLPLRLVNYFEENLRQQSEFQEEEPLKKLQEEYNALKKFWYWTCLNPKTKVVDRLFDFLEKNFLRLNRNGFFYALRNVVAKNTKEDQALIDFISQSWVKIKGQKKGPKGFEVLKKVNVNVELPSGDITEDEDIDVEEDNMTEEALDAAFDRPSVSVEYKLHKIGTNMEEGWEVVGNLDELYNRISEMKENTYTDNHTRKFDIRVGKPVSMDPADCSWSDEECAKPGLHFTMNEINYVGCGDTSMIILINPMKVVGIGEGKGRCYEYLPICTIPRHESTDFLRSGDFLSTEIEDANYAEEMAKLKETVEENFTIEKERYTFNAFGAGTTVNQESHINEIIGKLEVDYVEALNSRIQSID